MSTALALRNVPRPPSSRAAALDVYSAQFVAGAREWLKTGDITHLPRAWRERLELAAAKISHHTGAP